VIKRTIEISRQPTHIAVRDEQLLILRKTEPPRPLPAHPTNLAGSIPCEDLGVLMVDERDTTYSHSALVKLAEHGCALVVCGRDHHPAGMFLPISANTELLARLDAQLSATKPTVKRLWTIIVAAKVRAQADALPPTLPTTDEETEQVRGKLLALARDVRSGDPENIEAQAAAVYWPEVFRRSTFIPHPFRRRAGVARLSEPGSASVSELPPNNLLDYGYAALRAAVARSIVSAGLLPALGIKHRGRSNPFCLADDLMEPLRPLVDVRVRWLTERGEIGLDQTVKAELLRVLTDEVECGEPPTPLRGPLLVALTRYVASFVRVLTGEQEKPSIPRAMRADRPVSSGRSATGAPGADEQKE
jgi:CRISPR-associated protein Cas1